MSASSNVQDTSPFQRLVRIMDELREQCPWDRKQTMGSLRHLTIEEVYELADAIINDNRQEIKNELGDLLLHIVFYAKIASESHDFNIDDVIEGICEKLVRRHPHIYGDVKVENEEDVKANWEKIKLKEGRQSVLEGVPVSLPAMVKAARIQDKARGVGFDWAHSREVLEKVREELDELNSAIREKDHQDIEEEFGDVLFSMINYARFIHVNPEDALEKANKKFMQRFMFMEKAARQEGKTFGSLNLEEMETYWQQAKALKP